MVWMAEASMPRFGHGVFLHCLEQTYQKLSGMELKYSAVVGKPSEITYLYAEMQLNNHARRIGIHEEIKHLYAIGYVVCFFIRLRDFSSVSSVSSISSISSGYYK